jgi:diguanylate cyclase (GGDEF)-like protein
VDHAWKLVAAVGVALTAAHLLPSPVGDVVYLLAGGLALAAITVAVRRRTMPRPLPWVLVGAGLASWVAGDALWTWFDLVAGVDPFPSAADVLYLAGYPLQAAGLAVLVRRRTGGAVQRASLLDAAVLTTGLGLVTWVFLVVPTAESGITLVEKVVSTAYPVLDVVLLSLAIRLLLTFGGRTVSFRLLGTSMIVLLVSDVVYALYEMYGLPAGMVLSNVGFLLSYTAVAVAALHPTVSRLDEGGREPAMTLTRRRLVLLAAASFLAPAVQLATAATGVASQEVVTALASAALFGLVVLRLSGLAAHVQAQAHELAALVVTDPLTGAANRRGFGERLAALTARPDEPLVLAMLDLDHFKRWNDAHGHAAGDALLQDCVRAWRELLRGRDHLARWGGEEFAVLLDRCSREEAVVVVERLRAATPHGVTCSAGIAVWDGAESGDALFRRADKALYSAKAEGRDRSLVAEPDAAARLQQAAGRAEPVPAGRS